MDHDIRKDVLVVGGGMAGVASALQLRRAGHDVALIERSEVGGPATGASSGVLYYGSGTNLAPAIGLFGKERANLLWKATAEVIGEIIATAKKNNLDCGTRACGSIMVAKTEAEVAELQEEFAAVKAVGLPARLLSGREVKEYYPLRDFLGGLAYDGVGQVHPARLAAGAARAAGLEVYENTPLVEWKEEGGGVVVKTPRATIRAGDLVLATNKEPVFGLEKNFEIESSVILASQPTPRVKDVFPEEKIIWTMEDKYDMAYPRGDRLIMELYALGEEQSKMAYYFPGVEFRIEEQWGEVWSKPRDWIPIVGKVADHVTVAVGMGDQGIIMSWLSGSKMPLVIDGKSDWFLEMASPRRFGGEAPQGPEGSAPKAEQGGEAADGFEKVAEVSDVPVGGMKVVKLGGLDVMLANVGGSIYALPNKCTHQGGPLGKGKLAGSVVQCPFHGSKFDVKTGNVVGGPAKIPEPSIPVRVSGTSIWLKSP